jgi:hypothetical protein
MASMPPGTPVYIGKLARSLIDATQVFLGRDRYALDFHDFQAWQPFTIGEFTITPYLVDHSAADAYAFLIEAEGICFAAVGAPSLVSWWMCGAHQTLKFQSALHSPPGCGQLAPRHSRPRKPMHTMASQDRVARLRSRR